MKDFSKVMVSGQKLFPKGNKYMYTNVGTGNNGLYVRGNSHITKISYSGVVVNE